MNKDAEVPPPGARGPAYIALPNECGPSDQTDLNCTIFLHPLGRWSIIHEEEPDWLLEEGRRPRGEGGHLSPGPLGLLFVPVASGLL